MIYSLDPDFAENKVWEKCCGYIDRDRGRPTKSRLEAQSENLSSLSESLSSSSYSEFSSSFLGSANVDSSLSCIPND
ncbi:hypothetical protein OUZ56_014216 [Daphnia magna]|uniref:Uncharacterized protein n=1 Tax=Daphnia magna TaxID=35525 RepID=A0ABQ9Z862_9CRUS|nr:hypothetical protein OUZ56_014216 [Daphnia magna]